MTPTHAVLTLDEPLNWEQARLVGNAIDKALGGHTKVKLGRAGRRWTFTVPGQSGGISDRLLGPDIIPAGGGNPRPEEDADFVPICAQCGGDPT